MFPRSAQNESTEHNSPNAINMVLNYVCVHDAESMLKDHGHLKSIYLHKATSPIPKSLHYPNNFRRTIVLEISLPITTFIGLILCGGGAGNGPHAFENPINWAALPHRRTLRAGGRRRCVRALIDDHPSLAAAQRVGDIAQTWGMRPTAFIYYVCHPVQTLHKYVRRRTAEKQLPKTIYRSGPAHGGTAV